MANQLKKNRYNRLLKVAALLVLAVVPSWGRLRVQGDCMKGGLPAVTNGVQSAGKVMTSYPQCLVNVYLTGTTTAVNLYINNSGGVLANPFTAQTNGHWFFYVDNGRYDVTMSGGGFVAPYTLGDVSVSDPSSTVTNVDWITNVYNKPIVDLREYGAICNNSANDTAAVILAEASANEVITVPFGICRVADATIATLAKKYTGLGKFKGISSGAQQADNSVTVRTRPTIGNTALGAFQGDQQYVDARYFEVASTAAIADFTSSYYNYEINPYYIVHKSKSGSGDVVAFTNGLSVSGQKILTVNATSWASPGQTVKVGSDLYVVNTIQAGVSLTMVANLTSNYGSVGNSTKTPLYAANRTSQSTNFIEHWNTGGGDSQAFFALMYGDVTAASGVTNTSFVGSTTILGGGITATKNWNALVGSEIQFNDMDYLGNTYLATAVGNVWNFNRYYWAGTVNTSGTAVSWVSGGKFDTGWATDGSTVITINGVNYTVAAITSSINITINSTAGTQTGVAYLVDPAFAVNGAWVGNVYTCNGPQYCEAIMYGTGKWKEGISLAGLTLGSSQAAIILAGDQKIYMNGSTTNDRDVGYTLWTKTPGTTFFNYNTGLSQWQWWTGNVQSMSLTGGSFPTLFTSYLQLTGYATMGGMSAHGAATTSTEWNLTGTETGANNAIAAALLDNPGVAVPLATGLCVKVTLAHTLQAGVNTFNFNTGGNVAIKSNRNAANNIGTAWTSGGIVPLCYDGTRWRDMTQ
jgi:hypothetical protein